MNTLYAIIASGNEGQWDPGGLDTCLFPQMNKGTQSTLLRNFSRTIFSLLLI